MRVFLLLTLAVWITATPASAQDVCPLDFNGPIAAVDPAFTSGSSAIVTVPVFFHVITGAGGDGNVTYEQIQQQMEVLNQSFAAYGTYSFELVGISRVENAGWFGSITYDGTYADGQPERDAKQALAQDPRHILNIYTADLVSTLLGAATFPFTFSSPTQGTVTFDEDNYLNGVVLDYTVLPGGTHPTNNLGDLAVHEVGHYLGLYHPDANTCSGNTPTTCSTEGDGVCDTPQLQELVTNSANLPGTVCGGLVDLTRSFMNYTEDTYRNRFTDGQHNRMDFFGSDRASLGEPTAPERVTAGVTVTLEPGITFAYGVGESLTVNGALNASGATFTALSASQGWRGIRANTGSAVFLTGGSISRVNWSGNTITPPGGHGALEAVDAALGLDGVTVSNTVGASGLAISGSNGITTVTNSVIEGSGLYGISADGGATVSVGGAQTLIGPNTLGGVRASGYGSLITVGTLARVDNNLGYGVTSQSSATVRVSTPSGASANTSVSSNRGGLSAASSAFVDGGICGKTGCTHRPNRFNTNVQANPCSASNPTGRCDARATGTSAVVAELAYWNGRTDTTQIVRYRTAGSTISLAPLAATLSGFAEGPVAGRGMTAGPALGTADDVLAGHRTTPVALASEARQAGAEGYAEEAFDLVAEAVAGASTEADRGAAFGAALSLLADPNLAGADATAFAASLGAASGDAAPWAARALAAWHATTGDATGADALAVTLTQSTDAGHRAAGHGVRVRLAVEAGDAAAALARLDAFAAVTDETDEDGRDALDAATVLVAIAFPEAFAAGVPQTRGASAGRAGVAAKAGEGATATLAVWPNPSAGAVAVRLGGASGAATVAVFDALGRRVAVLHDGAVPDGGLTLSFGDTPLPAGVYVVHARVVGASTQTLVQRVTITR